MLVSANMICMMIGIFSVLLYIRLPLYAIRDKFTEKSRIFAIFERKTPKEKEMYENNNFNVAPGLVKKILWAVAAIILLIVAMAFVRPWYNVWSQEMEGKAEFAKAEQNRKIKIEEAKANLEAEKLNAQAEIERAKGAAEAIRIENGSITPTYIQYLWVRQQSDLSDKTVIYVPTETNLPILESTRALTSLPAPAK